VRRRTLGSLVPVRTRALRAIALSFQGSFDATAHERCLAQKANNVTAKSLPAWIPPRHPAEKGI
jgi:hypothetical protein